VQKDVVVRRSMHLLIALAPAYFLLPEDLPYVGIDRWVVLAAFLAILTVFDLWRKLTGRMFMGLRPHEKASMASFAWAALGIVVVLWLVPKGPATAALFGMAFVDPIAGELRSRYGQKPLTATTAAVAYFVLAFMGLTAWNEHDVLVRSLIAAVGACVAIPSEALKTRFVDDDLTMLVFPAAAMALLALAV
jgi:hypothetical protein